MHTTITKPIPGVSTGKCPYHVFMSWMDRLFHPLKTTSSSPKSDSQTEAAARCPILNSRLREHEHHPLKTTPARSEAERVLAQAREHIYHWPSSFSGFSSVIEYVGPEGFFSNEIKITPGQKNSCKFSDPSVTQWVDYQISEIIAHRSSDAGAHGLNQGPLALGDDDPLWGRRLDFVNDPMESFYRIKNHQLTQIGRSYPSQRFLVSILDQHKIMGLNCARYYNVSYWDRSSGALTKVETFQDEYQEIQGVWIPHTRLYCLTSDTTLSRLITFSDVALI